MGVGSVGVIVVTYRSGAILRECLAAILNDGAVGHVVVVDNGNGDAERAYLDRMADRVDVVRPSRNIGFAAGCNLGAAMARGEYLAFVNPDLIVSPGALGRIAHELSQRPAAWVAGPRLLDVHGVEQRGGRRDVLTPWRCLVETTGVWRLFPGHPHFQRFNWHQAAEPSGVAEVPTISGACMVVPVGRWRQLGGMDDSFFLHVEDIDLCLRVLKAGGRVLYCTEVPVIHHGQSSDAPCLFVELHKAKGLVRYFRKHFADSYPSWSLRVLEVLIWGHFMALAPFRMVRGGGRHERSAGPGHAVDSTP